MNTVISIPFSPIFPDISESTDLRELALLWLIEPAPEFKAEGVKKLRESWQGAYGPYDSGSCSCTLHYVNTSGPAVGRNSWPDQCRCNSRPCCRHRCKGKTRSRGRRCVVEPGQPSVRDSAKPVVRYAAVAVTVPPAPLPLPFAFMLRL